MELTLDIEKQRGGTLLKVILKEPIDTTVGIIEWNDRMRLIDHEISDLPFVRKTAYGKWLWNNEHELNRWLTYYHLRFTNEIKHSQEHI